ncbi:putative ribokinase [Glutamicibacter arilaitensis Re117]|uniref:Ribokinase n=1 Tax=Glutamicibacter arilaitensis (strain DSM 16368 / CIP 108037 / IAM 15318 / JCM 13566 / NCIMB 14258 / Re117) TaxID=861360 RepID=A0ABM9Q0B1_GLUAR|nr:ribokinase [Glutamicibacter arilaitensis]CBT76967.1 putative ribokinase [Glutamicibacter arilaitensis Re117]
MQQDIQVTIVGSSNVDITALMARLPGPGETVLADSYQLSPGGKGANQALAAQLAGAATEFIGAVGNDSHSAIALGQLEDAGVKLDRVARTEQPTGVAIIQVDSAAENSIAVISGANSTVTAQAVQAAGAIEGILVLQGEIPASGIKAAMDGATQRIVLNLAPVIELDREYLLKANPLVVNEHEAALILQQLDGSETMSTEAEPVIAQKLMAHGLASLVITLGANGCLVAEQGSGIQQLPAVKVKAVDTTGAGDAFTGAVAARLANGDDLVQAAEFAGKFAALTVQAHGAQASYPRSLQNL